MQFLCTLSNTHYGAVLIEVLHSFCELARTVLVVIKVCNVI